MGSAIEDDVVDPWFSKQLDIIFYMKFVLRECLTLGTIFCVYRLENVITV